jgi:glyoxylase-like metal-dependent hydrolase (beta-lactamase superfamily II)
VRILSREVGPFRENTYLVVDDETDRAVLVDPGDDGEAIVAMVEESGASLDEVWLTHAHLDHIGAISAVRRRYGRVPVRMHPIDQPVYDAASRFAEQYGVPFEQPEPHDADIAHGEALRVGNLSFTVLHLPGHSPGHVGFFGNGILLGGDVLFAGSIGRTDLPLANPAHMQRTLASLAELPRETVVYPGHGDATTIGNELDSNPFLNGIANVKRNTH